MTSNANDAMERNDVHVEAKILTYHTPKTELRLRRYKQSKVARKSGRLGFRGEVNLAQIQIWIGTLPEAAPETLFAGEERDAGLREVAGEGTGRGGGGGR